jgi:hypothetical protein
MKFKGDIIITDPCYIIKKRDETTRPKWKDYMDLEDYSGMTRSELMALGFFEQYKKLTKAIENWDKENPDDWEVCDFGDDMEALGIKNYISRDTIYGDWSCTTFNTDTKEPIGEFCADAGMVAVFLLDEVLKYNPDFDYHINRPWTTTWIKDFDGEVKFEKIRGKVRVVGKGNINFVGKQTGL